MRKLQLVYNDGNIKTFNPSNVTTHQHIGTVPSIVTLIEVLRDVSNGYI